MVRLAYKQKDEGVMVKKGGGRKGERLEVVVLHRPPSPLFPFLPQPHPRP